jgi:beta-glucosidase
MWVNDQQVLEHSDFKFGPTPSYSTQLNGPAKIRIDFIPNQESSALVVGVARADEFVDPNVKKIASQADAAIVFVGFNTETEGEGADRPFQLLPGQDELIDAVLSANRNTIVVITAGGNVDMTKWIDRVPAVMHAWYGGQEAGTALAQLVFGDYSPSGKLPVSFERRWEDNATHDTYYPRNPGDNKVEYTEGLFVGYRHFDKDNVKPLFPFGFGLSYTTFAYSNLAVAPAANGGATVSFDVRNTGRREGAEVAEVYVGADHSSVPGPVKELKGFTKVSLRPGESRHVTVPLDARAFQYYDVNAKDWTTYPGRFEILVGPSSAQIALRSKLSLSGTAAR